MCDEWRRGANADKSAEIGKGKEADVDTYACESDYEI